jgi:plasmid stabilization system protein ParE
MNYEIRFRVEAERDLDGISSYYDSILPILTERFFTEFFETLQYIEQNPNLFQVRYREIRIAPLYKFPYGIHYKERNGKVFIFRVLHTKRYFK